MRLRICLACSWLLACVGCGSSDGGMPSPGPSPKGCSALDFSAVDAAVTRFVTDQGLQGASAVIVQKDCGAVHTQGYGAFSDDRLYLVGSSSKVVSAGVLMKLADSGVLDLDAPIGQYLSGWGEGGKPEIETAQLLSNSSGLVSLTDNPLYPPYLCQYRTPGTLGNCAQTIYTANDASKRIPPDTAFHYGGAQWQLAGGLAEVLAGKPCGGADPRNLRRAVWRGQPRLYQPVFTRWTRRGVRLPTLFPR